MNKFEQATKLEIQQRMQFAVLGDHEVHIWISEFFFCNIIRKNTDTELDLSCDEIEVNENKQTL